MKNQGINKEKGDVLLKCLYSSMVTLNLINELPNSIFKQKIKQTGNKFVESLGLYENAMYDLFNKDIYDTLEQNQNALRDMMTFQLSLSENQLNYFNDDLEKLILKYKKYTK